MLFNRRWLRILGLAAAASCLSGLASAGCGSSATPISEIQGTGASSPLEGQIVTIEGVMTLDSRHPDGFGGFYLQQTDDATDRSDQTSEALFVYTRHGGGHEGDLIRLTGRVKEYHGLTELTKVSDLTVCGSGKLPAPIQIRLPWPGNQWPEQWENMRVAVSDPLTLIDPYAFSRFGELILASSLQVTPTEVMQPGPDTQSRKTEQERQRLILDDGRRAQNPESLPWPAALIGSGQSVRVGDRLHQLEGILDFRFGRWRLQPTRTPAIIQHNPRPEPPRLPANALRVVSLNVGNLFNGDGLERDFPTDRGAASPAQYRQQLDRIVHALQALSPDILAVAEIENDDYSDTSALAELTSGLGTSWRFISTPGKTGQDAIRTDLLYRSDRVIPVGPANRLQQGVYLGQGRPPITQVFRAADSDDRDPSQFRVVAAHLKSKSCRGANGVNKDQDDGQGCYSHRRSQATRAIIRWLNRLQERDRVEAVLVTGDLNSYAQEDPIQIFQSAGYTSLIPLGLDATCQSNQCSKATYLFQGRLGTLDYSLASASLQPHIVSASVWAINAQEFPALGYQGPLAAGGTSSWRFSDHNPIVTDLEF